MIKICFVLMLCILTISAHDDIKASPQKIQKKEVKSLEEPTWIFNTGMSKGKYHDRQDFGFVLPANTKLKVRQSNPNYKHDLTVRLLGNNGEKEKNATVGTEWETLTGVEALVPFVDTPYGESGAELEYFIEGHETMVILPIYQYRGDEEEFLETWDKFDSSFALIQGKVFQILLPKEDKQTVRDYRRFNSLDQFIEKYHEVFAYFDKLTGFDESSKTNQNSANRYFLKADKSGTGWRYYSDNWTAKSASSTEAWFEHEARLTSRHYIAEGYQMNFGDQGMNAEEIISQFSTFLEYKKYGKKADLTSHRFSKGKKHIIDEKIYKKIILDKDSYNSLDETEKLLLLALLLQKAGMEALTKMYQDYRKISSEASCGTGKHQLPDLYNHYCSENSKLDFTPFLEILGLPLKSDQGELNRMKGYPAVATLAHVVPETHLSKARQILDQDLLLTCNFELVTNSEIVSLGLRGNLSIELQTNDTEDSHYFTGLKLILIDGNKTVQEQPITDSKTFIFEDIPNGIYRLVLIDAYEYLQLQDTNYVYVKDAENNKTIFVQKYDRGYI